MFLSLVRETPVERQILYSHDYADSIVYICHEQIIHQEYGLYVPKVR